MFSVSDSSSSGIGTISLHDETAGSRATIAPSRGALTTSFFALGQEWLFLDQATFADPSQNVRGGVPVLFPSPGKLENDRYARGSMKQHGFARTSAFREVGRGSDSAAWVELELVDSDSTRAQYPWRFSVRLRFSLRGAQLSLDAQVENRGSEPMPFALGYHPYFAVPVADKARSRIPTRATRAWDNVKKANVDVASVDLASGEVDLHLLDHGSPDASLETPTGTLTMRGPFSRWVIWTLPSRDFVCLEPWTAPGNALNSGEGLTMLAPGATSHFGLTFTASGVAAER
ncbi:MAG: galactose mutarotase [Archangium sp.]|nr:galactose mutarotase [Archangium sp.]